MGFQDTDWWQSDEYSLDEQLAISRGIVDERNMRGDTPEIILEEMTGKGASEWDAREYESDFPDIAGYFNRWSTPQEKVDQAYLVSSMLYRRAVLERTNRNRAAHALLASAFHGIGVLLKNAMSMEDSGGGGQSTDDEYCESDDSILTFAILYLCRNAIHAGLYAEEVGSLESKRDVLGEDVDHPSFLTRSNHLSATHFAMMAEAKRKYAEALLLPRERRPDKVTIPNYAQTFSEAVEIENFREEWSAVENRNEYTHYLAQALQDVIRELERVIARNERGPHIDVSLMQLNVILLHIQTALCDALEVVFSPIEVVDPNDEDVRFQGMSHELRSFALSLEGALRKPLTREHTEFLLANSEEIMSLRKADKIGYRLKAFIQKPGSPFCQIREKKGTNEQKPLTEKERRKLAKLKRQHEKERRKK